MERQLAQLRTEASAAEQGQDGLETTLYEELARLPDRYRQVLTLCHLEGRTHEQAARQLGWPVGSVSRRLRRGCELLRERLAGRGVVLSVGGLATVLADQGRAARSPGLMQTTTSAVTTYTTGSTLVAPRLSRRCCWQKRSSRP